MGGPAGAAQHQRRRGSPSGWRLPDDVASTLVGVVRPLRARELQLMFVGVVLSLPALGAHSGTVTSEGSGLGRPLTRPRLAAFGPENSALAQPAQLPRRSLARWRSPGPSTENVPVRRRLLLDRQADPARPLDQAGPSVDRRPVTKRDQPGVVTRTRSEPSRARGPPRR